MANSDVNWDNERITPMRIAWSGTGTITVPRNDRRNGLTIEAAVANGGTITYQFTGGPNTNAVMQLVPGGAVQFSRKKGDNPILACSIVCGADTALIEEW